MEMQMNIHEPHVDELKRNIIEAYDAVKDDHSQVVVALAVDSTRVRAMAESRLLSPELSAMLAGPRNFEGGVQLISCHRDKIDVLFAAANTTPVDVPVAEMIDTIGLAGWPILVAVDDRLIGIHIMRRGKVPAWDQPIVGVSWPERVLDHSRS
jgi:hypothetical protein